MLSEAKHLWLTLKKPPATPVKPEMNALLKMKKRQNPFQIPHSKFRIPPNP